MHTEPQQPEPADERAESPRRGQPLWFWAILAAMLLAFGVVVIERNVIRSYWWAHRLAECDDLKQQAYYINALMNVGDAANGAVQEMMSHERAPVRAAAVLILAQSRSSSQVADLKGLLVDADREVRESAARTLAFLDRADAEKALLDTLTSDNTDAAAAAAAGLSRVATDEAISSLCRAIASHPAALVRAQAVESLGALLMSSPDAIAVAGEADCDPVAALVEALSDKGTYQGTLALEREIDAARGAAATGNEVAAAHIVAEVQTTSTPSRVGNVARRAIEALLDEPLETPIPKTPDAAAELADSLRRHIAERGVRFQLPTTLPVPPSIKP